jgi:heat shock protein HslJ
MKKSPRPATLIGVLGALLLVAGCVQVPPAVQAPATVAPATRAPSTAAPLVQAPTTNAAVTQVPATVVPAIEAPATQAPATVIPATQPPPTVAPAGTIQGVLWQWMTLTNQSTRETTSIPDPEEYTITFNAGGALTGRADCNTFVGTYSQENGFSITIGAMTTEACGPKSLDRPYLKLLSSVAAGGPDGQGNLALETAGGEQRMLFADGGSAATASSAALTEDQLANAVYNSEFTASGTAPLVDGVYEEEAAPGSASKVTVTLTQHATGDLDGDGVPDAAAILATNTGGTGTFITLEAVLSQGGLPVHEATAPLGDRTQVKAVSIAGGVIALDMIVHGPQDPMCCPTQPAATQYRLQGGQLMQIAGPTPVVPASG